MRWWAALQRQGIEGEVAPESFLVPLGGAHLLDCTIARARRIDLTDVMGKSWPFSKTKNDHEASGSRSGKKPRVGQYIHVEFAHRLWEENRAVPWPDASLPGGGWYLNSKHVPVPPVPREGRERRDDVRRRRAILLVDLREDRAYALNSYNWISFGTWEFDARRQAWYLGDVDYFDLELVADDDDNEGEYDDVDVDADDDTTEASSDGHI
jgi:hypothetical protein